KPPSDASIGEAPVYAAGGTRPLRHRRLYQLAQSLGRSPRAFRHPTFAAILGPVPASWPSSGDRRCSQTGYPKKSIPCLLHRRCGARKKSSFLLFNIQRARESTRTRSQWRHIGPLRQKGLLYRLINPSPVVKVVGRTRLLPEFLGPAVAD